MRVCALRIKDSTPYSPLLNCKLPECLQGAHRELRVYILPHALPSFLCRSSGCPGETVWAANLDAGGWGPCRLVFLQTHSHAWPLTSPLPCFSVHPCPLLVASLLPSLPSFWLRTHIHPLDSSVCPHFDGSLSSPSVSAIKGGGLSPSH